MTGCSPRAAGGRRPCTPDRRQAHAAPPPVPCPSRTAAGSSRRLTPLVERGRETSHPQLPPLVIGGSASVCAHVWSRVRDILRSGPRIDGDPAAGGERAIMASAGRGANVGGRLATARHAELGSGTSVSEGLGVTGSPTTPEWETPRNPGRFRIPPTEPCRVEEVAAYGDDLRDRDSMLALCNARQLSSAARQRSCCPSRTRLRRLRGRSALCSTAHAARDATAGPSVRPSSVSAYVT